MAGKTIYSLNDVHAQVLLPSQFCIRVVNTGKNNIEYDNFINAGYFGNLADGGTIQAGHLVVDGKVISNSATQASWMNTANKSQTTLIVGKDDTVEIVEVADISEFGHAKYAISGIPILKNGYTVSMDYIKKQGWFGNELYRTWHNFVGVRNGKIVIIAAKIAFNLMPYLMEVFGLNDCIKLDGGGSFIMKSGDFKLSTSGNRKINNIITW